MTLRGARPGRWPGALLAPLVLSCSSSPVTIIPPPVEIVVASGDAQFGTVGQPLANPLRAVVLSTNTGAPQEGLSVEWAIDVGAASLLGAASTLTDEAGAAEVRVQLGATPGDVVVRATVAAQPGASTTFSVFSVDPPILTQVAPPAAGAGETVTLSGANFSPVDSQNVVLFSGVRGAVQSATTTSLTVEVPRCLPARDVRVQVQLGVVASDSLPLTVSGGGEITPLAVGEVLDVADDGGLVCHGLEGGIGARYLTLVYSASTVGGAEHPFRFTALSSSGASAAPPTPTAGRRHTDVGPDPQAEWDRRLRELEADMARSGPGRTHRSPARARAGPAAVPAVGESRSFFVLNGTSFAEVTAVAEYVGSQAAIFVDVNAPENGFVEADYVEFSQRFDGVIHPEVTAAFGEASDLDANERVVILFTPVVNGLTPRGTSGFIGGFFFGRDLRIGDTGSNEGEVFYALVPDPAGQFSDPRSRTQVLSVVPAVLAHEFQHMVHWNERVITLGAGAQEALWLSEGLAQMAEEVVTRAYDALGDEPSAALFRSGTRIRARRYLAETDVSVIVTTGQGSLAERGAGFLQMLYLEDHAGTEILGRLTRSIRTGVANVEAEFGTPWADLLADWWSATYLDGPGAERGALTYPDFDLPGFLGDPYPLLPTMVGAGDFEASGSLWSSSVRYYILVPDAGGSTTVRLGGEAGGASAAQSAMRMRIIRLS